MGIIHTSINSHEDSLDDDDPVNTHHSENPGIDYKILSTGSQRGNPALFDSKGFSYTINRAAARNNLQLYLLVELLSKEVNK